MVPASELPDGTFNIPETTQLLESGVQPPFERRQVSVSLGQHAVVHEQFTKELHSFGLGERVEGFVGQCDVPVADGCQETGGGCAAFPGVDTLRTSGISEDVDESFEPQIRGSVGFQDVGQIGS